MTFRVHFYADQLFFEQVKLILNSRIWKELDLNQELALSANSIVLLHSWLEACLNLIWLWLSEINFEVFERESIQGKIKVLYKNQSLFWDWNKAHLNNIRQLSIFRNWLTYYKDPHIWLLGSEGYIKETDFIESKLKPEELKLDLIAEYYSSILFILKWIIISLWEENRFDYLFTEIYSPISVW